MAVRSRVGGFTLIELMIVVAIIGLLSAIAIPQFLRFQLKSKTAEAKTNLAAISVAEESYLAEHGDYVAALSTPPGAPSAVRRIFGGGGQGSFETLGWHPEGLVYFQYGVALRADAPLAFTADAAADIDGDGAPQIWGFKRTDPGGQTAPVGENGCVSVVAGFAVDVVDTVGPCDSGYGQTIF